ncbi:LacI family DNA-binding transcriptional regulator [Labrys neptuniae]
MTDDPKAPGEARQSEGQSFHRPGRRPTVADVARAANVSSMTVSNVVNERFGSMTKETRATVERAIREIGYRPHASGRSLKLAKRFSIGVVVIDESPTFLADPFITYLIAGLSNYLNQRDYGLVVQGMSAEQLQEAALMKRHETDALCVFLSGPQASRRKLIARFAALDQPVVVFQEPVPDKPLLHSIRQDDFGGARALAEHMLERGVERIVFLAPEVSWPAIEQRVAGARAAMTDAGRAEAYKVVICGDGGFAATHQALAEETAASGWPSAVMGGNDQIGIAALKWLAGRGLRVPDDILVSGFNAFDAWQYTDPVLTTVSSPAYAMGAKAGEIVLDTLHGNPPATREHLFPVAVQIGGST